MAGDLLLVMAGPNFKNKIKNGKDLYSLQYIDEPILSNNRNPRLFLLGLLAIISLTFFGFIDFFVSLLLALFLATFLKLFDTSEAKKQTSMELLLILGGAITIGKGFIDTGAAEIIITPLMEILKNWSPIAVITMLYLITVVFTSFVTNVAAVSILFPLAFELIKDVGLEPTPTYLALAFGASAAFLTPVSYQTNLMVYGPGKYFFKDFVKIGLPFLILYSALALITIFALHNLL
jgi:di/tricarboxylate transporter